MAHSRQAWRGNNIGNQAKSIPEFDCNRLVCKDSGYSPASREGILIKFHLQQIGHNSIGVNSWVLTWYSGQPNISIILRFVSNIALFGVCSSQWKYPRVVLGHMSVFAPAQCKYSPGTKWETEEREVFLLSILNIFNLRYAPTREISPEC